MQILSIIDTLKEILPEYTWVVSPNLDLGILTSNYAFTEAKKMKSNPKELAETLAIEINQILINNNLEYQVKVVGPYLNLVLADSFWESYVQTDWCNVSLDQIQSKLLLEFISNNIAKPLHAGHLLQANYGEALRRILTLKYKEVITDCHWGDWGVNIGKLLWGFDKLKEKQILTFKINEKDVQVALLDYEDNPIETMSKVYIWSNQQKDLEPNYTAQIKQKTKLLETGEVVTRALWQKFVDDSRLYTHEFLKQINIKPFNLEQGESFYEQETENLSNFLEQSNFWHKLEKGRFLEKEDLDTNLDQSYQNRLKNFGRCYLRESTSGYTTYALRDVAARIQWARDLRVDKMITLVGNEQIHHFNQFISITNWLSLKPEFISQYGEQTAEKLSSGRIESLHNGFITLAGGEKMSARTGNFLTAQYLLNTVKDKIIQSLAEKNEARDDIKINIMANASLKWFNLNRDISQDAVCNLETILKFEGNTGIYQLYTVARLNSILNKNIGIGIKADNLGIKWQKLNSIEHKLIQKTIYLDQVLNIITVNYKPHILTTFLYELCNDINSWYAKYSVTNEIDSDRKVSMLVMCQKLNQVLKFSLDLLAIKTLETL